MLCDSFVGFGFGRDWALQHVLDIMIDIDFHAFPELFFLFVCSSFYCLFCPKSNGLICSVHFKEIEKLCCSSMAL